MKSIQSYFIYMAVLLLLSLGACSSGGSSGAASAAAAVTGDDTSAVGDSDGTTGTDTSSTGTDSSKPDVQTADTSDQLINPETPTLVSAQSSIAGQIQVSWSGSSNNGRYMVLLTTEGTFSTEDAVETLDPAVSPQTVTGLDGGSYYVWVVPVDAGGTAGEGVAANSGSIVAVEGTSPSPEGEITPQVNPDTPTGITVVSNGDGEITVSWTGESNDGSYTVIVDDDTVIDDDEATATQEGAASPTVISGLDSGDYTVWVIVNDPEGNQVAVALPDDTTPVAVSNPATDPVETPSSVSAQTPSLGSAVISWSGNENSGSYTVVIDDDYLLDNDTPVQTIENATSPLTVDSLSSNSYYFWVIPVDDQGTEGTPVAADSGNSLAVYNGNLQAADDVWSVYEGRSAVIPLANLLDNDSNNMTGDPLEIVEIKNVSNGSAELSGSSVTFTSTGGAGVDAGFTYVARIKDVDLYTVEASVAITVNAVPDLIAGEDQASVQQGGEIYFSVSSLLSNDEGDTITFHEVYNPVRGTLTVDGEVITFISTGLAYETTQFNYRITDKFDNEAIGTVFITVDPLPEKEAFVYGDLDTFNQQMAVYTPPTMDAVFNSWARFDGNNYFEGKDAAGITFNANAWEFLSDPERVSMPENVSPYNGFISPQELESYTFEATVTSPDGDDDNIGLVIAFVRIDGINYSLTAVRTRGGMEPYDGWGIVYNVEDGATHTNKGNGGRIIAEQAIGSIPSGGWYGKKTRIKIERDGDEIICYASDWDNTQTYEPSSKIVIDLNSDPDLYKFKGAKPYGYMSFSQPDSTYLDISLEGGLDTSTMMYVDWDTGVVQVWTYVNGAWTISTDTIQDVLGYVRIVTNPVTGNRYLITADEVKLLEE